MQYFVAVIGWHPANWFESSRNRLFFYLSIYSLPTRLCSPAPLACFFRPFMGLFLLQKATDTPWPHRGWQAREGKSPPENITDTLFDFVGRAGQVWKVSPGRDLPCPCLTGLRVWACDTKGRGAGRAECNQKVQLGSDGDKRSRSGRQEREGSAERPRRNGCSMRHGYRRRRVEPRGQTSMNLRG